MKRKKQMALFAAFALGIFLLAGSVLADIRDRSGYEQLKDAIKLAATNCTENYQSFTAEISVVLKNNGQELYSEHNLMRYDRLNGAKEDTSTTKAPDGGGRSYYDYLDKNQRITKSSHENSYFVINYEDEKNTPLITKEDNPFNSERVQDMERILDALVGALKEQVVVIENADGSKTLSGKLSEGQIPTLINALASFLIKQELNSGRNGLINLASDIYIGEVWGTAKVNEDGCLENIMGTTTISGLDTEGLDSEIVLEALFQLSEVNTTKVVKPDLRGEEVVTRLERDFDKAYKPTAEKFVGKFKNDILMEEGGRFIKIGERRLEITRLDDAGVQGSYYEELLAGYEKYAGPLHSYTFEAKFSCDGDDNNAVLEGATEEGVRVEGNIYFNGRSARIYLNHGPNRENSNVIDDNDFYPDFD